MKTITPRAALLPFYLKLYDDLLPESRQKFDGYIQHIVTEFTDRGIEIETGSVCRLAGEFEKEISRFEKADLDCIVTLHLAYSPSMEAIDAFCKTNLPIVILDATMDGEFGRGVSPDRIMFNHGVHGVMDFASLLRRRERRFEIVAGHDSVPRTMDRASEYVRAASAAKAFGGTRALRVGEAFQGMGDFTVPESVMAEKLDVTVDQIGVEALEDAINNVTADEIDREVATDRERFNCELESEAHTRSVRVGLGLRRVLNDGEYGAFSVNFQAFDSADRAANTMPFLEISKSMARGVGYAGEGDVLTASLVGALARSLGEVTFTEIFCADWAGNSLFLSHMGEISPTVAGDVPRLFSKPFFAGGSLDPAILTCAVRPGPGVFVNLTPGPDDSFSLIVAPVEVLSEGESIDPDMRDVVRAWIRPEIEVSRFLERYSRAGGTHHSALVLGDRSEAIASFGRIRGFEVVEIGNK